MKNKYAIVPPFEFKICERCGESKGPQHFSRTHSIFYKDGFCPLCDQCITVYLKKYNFDWEQVDRLCQYAGIPFIPKEFERLKSLNSEDTIWHVYAEAFSSLDYESLDWHDYFQQFKALREAGLIEDELPELDKEKYDNLRKVWGGNYDDEDLLYLEDLYKGLTVSHNITDPLQKDQAQKICKLSLEIDNKIRAGDKDVEKFLSSYDRLVKTAELSPNNAVNAVDFDSAAEVFYWLEKRGNVNHYYDDVTRDVIDETQKTLEAYNQKLYLNEGGMGEAITERLKALKITEDKGSKEDSIYGLPTDFDVDAYDNDVYNMEELEENFEVGGASHII